MNPGQVVVCIRSHIHGVYVKDKEYLIEGVKMCKCGKINLLLKGVYNTPGYEGSRCTYCGSDISETEQYCNADNFVPLDYWQQAERLVNEIKREILEPIPL